MTEDEAKKIAKEVKKQIRQAYASVSNNDAFKRGLLTGVDCLLGEIIKNHCGLAGKP